MRSPLLAGLLTLAASGLGHVYLGRPKRGAAWFGASLALIVLLSTLGVKALGVKIVVLAALAALGVKVLICFDAVRICRTIGAAPRARYQRWYVYFGLFLAASLAGNAAQFGERSFNVPSASMADTILPGDRVLVDETAFRLALPGLGPVLTLATPQRGDLVVFRWVQDPTTTFLKRVVGLPGEDISCAGQALVVDGKPLSEPYVTQRETPNQPTCAPRHLQDQEYFLVGDSRGNSTDSRNYGPVPLANITGRAVGIVYSVDPNGHQVRWERSVSGFSAP